MREISVRSLLISHLAMVILFCLFFVVGYGVILTVMHLVTGAELSDLHQRLKSDRSSGDIQFASFLSLAALAAGWLAARTSGARPLVHGALSSAVFFLLSLCLAVYEVFQHGATDLLWSRPLLNAPLALPVLGLIGGWIFLLGQRMPRPKQSSNENAVPIPDGDLRGLGPIAWKWLVRLIWVASITAFEALEVRRYWHGETYRPLFGLFVAAICACVIWQVASAFRDSRRRRQARRLSSPGFG